MLIKYNGPKRSKTLEWSHKDWGLMTYVFNPVCKVTDSDFAKFLLHPDKQGLFSIVEESEAPKEVNEPEKPKDPIKAPLDDLPTQPKKRVLKKNPKPERLE